MDDCSREEENNELRRDVRDDGTAGEGEKNFGNQYQLMRKSPFNNKHNENEQNDRKSSRSRSRSRGRQSQGQRRSTNAFINFMQDFKQNYGKVRSTDLFRLGGQRWREMSSEEKMPYLKAAKLAKQQSQQQTNKSEQTKKTNSGDSTRKSETQKNQKKKEREERRRSGSRTEESDMESDSATSGTAASMTSEDVSDLSS